MSKILNNTTNAPIEIADAGVLVDNVTNFTIPPQDYLIWAASSDIITQIGNGNIIVNDGSFNLNISDGTDLIKGLFPSNVTTITVDGPEISSTGQKRVSQTTSVFQGKFDKDPKENIFEKLIVGSATIVHNTTKSLIELTTTTLSGDRAVKQSKEYIQYLPGTGLFMDATAIFDIPKANVEQRLMYGDDDNGIGVEYIGTIFNVFIRSSVSGVIINNRVPQSNWNLDKMDGTGKSGVTLNQQANNIYVIDLLWLSAGRVRLGVEIDGRIIYMHQFLHANIITGPFMQTASLPIRCEIVNTGVTASNTKLQFICCNIKREGISNISKELGTANMSITTKLVGQILIPLVSIRLKSTFKRSQIIPIDYNVTEDKILVQLIKNASLTGAIWVNADGGNITQKDVSSTSLSGGIVVQSFYADKRTVIDLPDLKLLSNLDGTIQDILTIAVQRFAGNKNISASMNFEEVV